MLKNNRAMCVAAVCVAACSSTFAAEGPRLEGLSINVGLDYSSGKYGGADRTTIWSVPISAKYVTGPVAFRVATSWLQVSGTGAVIASGLGGIGDDSGLGRGGSGGGGSSSGAFSVPGCDSRKGATKPEDDGPCVTGATAGAGAATAPVRTTESGMGDVVASVIYTPIDRNGLIVDLIGKVKFATASDSKGLGSGKTDYAVQIEAEQSFGKAYVNAGAGYKWLGDPTGISLRNVVFGAIGGGYKPTGDTTVGISYDYAQSARSGGTAAQEISLYASQRFTKHVKLNGFVFKGLSDGSPDWGAGVSLGYRF